MMSERFVNTAKASRRNLSFHCTGCLKEDLARIEQAHQAGTLECTGNWTPGEVFDHVAKVWEFAFEGFPPDAHVSLPIRVFARIFKGKFTSGKTLPAGFKLDKRSAYMQPAPGCAFDVGLARLRRVVDRLDRGEQMTQSSPAFGRMHHDEWMRLHLGHAQLHLGFLHPRA